MKKHQRARVLAEAMSPWIYSEGTPPKALNDLFLKWLRTHDVPSYREIQNALNDNSANGSLEPTANTKRDEGDET